MGTPASISLKVLLSFLSPVLQAKLNERVKKKDSSQIAKERAFSLYKNLGEMKAASDELMTALRDYIASVQVSSSEELQDTMTTELNLICQRLMETSSKMLNSLEALYPQLEIHQYQLYREISWYRDGWGVWLDWDGFQDALILAEDEENYDELDRMLREEEESYHKLDECLKSFREFLANEFPFSNSF